MDWSKPKGAHCSLYLYRRVPSNICLGFLLCVWRCLRQTYTLIAANCTVTLTTRRGTDIFMFRLKLFKEFAIVMVWKTQPECPKQTVSLTFGRSSECLKISRRFSQKYGECQVGLILLNTFITVEIDNLVSYCFTFPANDAQPSTSYPQKNYGHCWHSYTMKSYILTTTITP